jgi:hypothetical protein
MELFITTQGDRSVGMFPTEFKIQSNLTIDKNTPWEEREELKTTFVNVVKEVADDHIADAYFSDECSECGALLDDDGKCPNSKNCPTGMHDHEMEEV